MRLQFLIALGLISFVAILLGFAVPTIHKVNTQTYLDAGQDQIKANKYEEAAQSFRQYTKLRPNNPLGFLALALALSHICGRHPCPEAIEAAHKGGVASDRLSDLGDAAFENHDWGVAYTWYERVIQLQGDSSSSKTLSGLTLRAALSAALAGLPEAKKWVEEVQHVEPQFATRRLNKQEALVLSAPDFFWIFPTRSASQIAGETLQYESPAGLGTFWWGSDAEALIHIDEPGQYIIEANLRHVKPTPIKMAIGINGTKLTTVSFLTGGQLQVRDRIRFLPTAT